MSQTFPEPLFERVRDHLERAAAILPREAQAQRIRGSIEEAIELALECAYRSRSQPSLRVLEGQLRATSSRPAG